MQPIDLDTDARPGAVEPEQDYFPRDGYVAWRHPRLVIPFVKDGLADETRAYGEARDAVFVDLTAREHGYFDLFARLWSERHSFVILEQDIVPADGVWEEMIRCPEPWCAGLQKLHEHAPEVWSLGFMRFRSELLGRHFAQVHTGTYEPDGAKLLAQVLGENKSWRRLDLGLYDVLRMVGLTEPHLHGPSGRHLSIEMNARRGFDLHA
jgi:hypothetical protein